MYAKNLIIQAFLGQNINKMCKIYDFGVFFCAEKILKSNNKDDLTNEYNYL